jgi:nicotinate dehydrogenase subunit B
VTEHRRPRRPWDRTVPSEREYFDLLGPGLVAVAPPRKPGGPGASGWSPPTGGAWVHVGEDGKVLAFSGKAEVGQGTRPALALVVAEELHVAPTAVELVMGDTDLCPWDLGTFGSRSMPDAAPAVAAAAAGARAELVQLAARRLGAAASELEAAEGRVRRRGTSDGVRYEELVHGGRYLAIVDPGSRPAPASVGRRAGAPALDLREEGVVTGRATYVSDVVRPRMLHAAILWPPSYGARLLHARLPAAHAAPGVTFLNEGGIVAAAAATAAAARAALLKVRARWETPPQPGEREVEAYLRGHPSVGDDWDTDEEKVGDVDRAFASAPIRLEATYRSSFIAHVPLEPHCAVAEWDGGRLTVWVGTQTPFRARATVARAVGVPEDDVRVIVPPTGSGFGGKHGGEIATVATRLARAAGRPVRLAFSREEEFRHAYLRPMSIVDVRAAAGRDGAFLAWSFVNVNGGAAALRAPYRVPNLSVGNVLCRSPLPQGSYRALAANANNFARESAVDELARLAGVDPLDVRERNLDDERLRTVLRRAVARAGWKERARGPSRGFGLAVGLEKDARVATVAEVTVSADRRPHVDRLVTAFEAGAIVHPDNLRSQVEGAQVMALGGALFEKVDFGEGSVRNPRLSQYRVPRFSDVPRVEVELVDAPDLPSSGAGETPMIAVAPAVANAIFDAAGCRLRSLPLVPTGRVPNTSPAAE